MQQHRSVFLGVIRIRVWVCVASRNRVGAYTWCRMLLPTVAGTGCCRMNSCGRNRQRLCSPSSPKFNVVQVRGLEKVRDDISNEPVRVQRWLTAFAGKLTHLLWKDLFCPVRSLERPLLRSSCFSAPALPAPWISFSGARRVWLGSLGHHPESQFRGQYRKCPAISFKFQVSPSIRSVHLL